MPNNAVCLARVAVAAAAASIVNANITDLRPYAPLGVLPVNSARRPGVLYGPYSQEPAFKSVPVAGQMIFEQDTGLLYVYNGSAWVCITPKTDAVATDQTTASTAYADLATTGPAVTLQTGTKALFTLTTDCYNTTAGTFVNASVAVSGATTLAASDTWSTYNVSGVANFVTVSRTALLTGLTPGVNTFTAKYRANAAGTAHFAQRSLTVVGIP